MNLMWSFNRERMLKGMSFVFRFYQEISSKKKQHINFKKEICDLPLNARLGRVLNSQTIEFIYFFFNNYEIHFSSTRKQFSFPEKPIGRDKTN